MRLKIDLFTWTIIGVVLALVVAAVVTVNLSSGTPTAARSPVEPESPAAPVVAAILAVQQGDVSTARAQFTAEALADYETRGYDPIANSAMAAANSQNAQRVRIVNISAVTQNEEGRDQAFVTIAEDNFSGGGGLFGRSTWSSQRLVRVEREEGVWKVADPNLFY
jgi:hypothetical protein